MRSEPAGLLSGSVVVRLAIRGTFTAQTTERPGRRKSFLGMRLGGLQCSIAALSEEINNNFWGSHALWRGVKCRDVLRAAGLDVDGLALGRVALPAKYLRLTGHDADERLAFLLGFLFSSK